MQARIKTYLLVGCCLFLISGILAQEQRIADSLFQIYKQNTLTDTAKFSLLFEMSFNETEDYNRGLKYAEELIQAAQQAGNTRYVRSGYFLKGTDERLLGRLSEALSAYIKSAELAKQIKNFVAEADSYSAIGDVYSSANNHATAKQYYNQAVDVLRKSKDSSDSVHLASTLLNAGDEFRKNGDYDTALLYCNEAKIIVDKINYLRGKAYSVGNIGMVYAGLGKNALAEKNINEAVSILDRIGDYYPICDYLISMADVYTDKNDLQMALKYASKSLQLAQQYKLVEQISNADLKLSGLYEKSGDAGQSLKLYKDYILYRDSLYNIQSVQAMADKIKQYEVSKKQAEVNLLNEQKTNQRYLLLLLGIILYLAIVILIIMIRSNRHKQVAYEVLNKQKLETDVQKSKAEVTLNELQSTQAQLIQTAKMASLGELTAGIAHEIQNPLNFVNNFAEVNNDLIEEMNSENDIQELKAIAKDIRQNNEKITYHGKRADAIVKGMLQHSRQTKGIKEPTDINALCDEFLRLSYHGLRAKDKNFNADFKTNLDETIGEIDIVPQDIGRVLLNLFNNAFYAVKSPNPLKGEQWKPLVSVTTKKIKPPKSNVVTNSPAGHGGIEIIISDNGNGIPKNIIDKIFQPFFTTKPAGEGTGLGLSLAYDIITKEHNGTIKVESKEGEGTEFIINLPVA